MSGLMSKAEIKGEVAKLCQSIEEKVERQYEHSVKENIPRGILMEHEVGPHAIRSGIVSALTESEEWSIPDLLELCADIMEDANDSDTAAELRGRAQEIAR